MNIVPSEINSANALLRSTELADKLFYGFSATLLVSSVWESVTQIWQNVEETAYTNHDINHSLHIIKYFFQLDKLYEWSTYEKLIFVIAALIHDIGMQYNIWGPGLKLDGLPHVRISSSEVRRLHAETGAALVFGFVSGKIVPEFPPPFCSGDLQKTALTRAASVAFAHSGEDFLKLLEANNPNNLSRPIEGHKYRPRLLAGILRLCDELDGSYERIRQPGRLYSSELEKHSRMHWFSCYLVESTEVTVTDEGVANINLQWRVPDSASETQRSDIRLLLGSMREAKIRNEIEFVNNFFSRCKEPQHKKPYVVTLASMPTTWPFEIKSEFVEMLQTSVQSRNDIAPGTIAARKTDETGACNFSAADVPIEIFSELPVAVTLDDALLRWFNSNRDIGHYELQNGEHTDTYLNCRTLVSNQDLILMISDQILGALDAENIKITDVLAVGTSAIPLAVNLSHRLQCASSFTMFRRQYGKKASYHPIEVMPSIQENGVVLIVDDVISGGRVASKTLDTVAAFQPKAVYHQAIFRLGKREYVPDARITKYFSVIHIDSVNYFSKDQCKLCDQGLELICEAEMH